jgi:hypothetical protein
MNHKTPPQDPPSLRIVYIHPGGSAAQTLLLEVGDVITKVWIIHPRILKQITLWFAGSEDSARVGAIGLASEPLVWSISQLGLQSQWPYQPPSGAARRLFRPQILCCYMETT